MNPARIAIVDDDPAFSQYLSVLLGSKGYDAITFKSGAELVQSLGADRPPDVVLLDVLMPGMDGLETLRVVRTSHPSLQVIMLSGTQVPSTIVDAVRLGAIDYVVKPDDPEGLGEAALESAIRHAVEKLSLTSEVARLRAQVVDSPDGAQPCWGAGAAMRRVLTMVERVADSDVEQGHGQREPCRADAARHEEGDIRTDHEERAMGQVDDAHDAEDQRQAAGDQEQQEPVLHPVEELREKAGETHQCPLRREPSAGASPDMIFVMICSAFAAQPEPCCH